MIGFDLLRAHDLSVDIARKYLGEPEQWITLSLGLVYDRLRARGWDVTAVHSIQDTVAAMKAGTLAEIPDFVPPPPGEGLHEITAPAEVPTSRYICPKGHEWTAIGEYCWEANYRPATRSGPLCPYCVIDFANLMFPASRAG